VLMEIGELYSALCALHPPAAVRLTALDGRDSPIPFDSIHCRRSRVDVSPFIIATGSALAAAYSHGSNSSMWSCIYTVLISVFVSQRVCARVLPVNLLLLV
jgi:hypothetical protein